MNLVKAILASWLLIGLASLSALAPLWAAEEARPRVLVLGDSIYNQPSRSVASELKAKVDLTWKHPGDTATALARLDELLGAGKWDVIHFNFGLADLHYKDPGTKSIRAMSKHAGGVRVTSVERYERNLHDLVKRLKSTGAQLVWASTTPIPSSQYDEIYDPGSEIEYNAVAARVMAQHGVSVNDMHAYMTERVEQVKSPSPFGAKEVPLHPPLAGSILKALNNSPLPAD